MSKAKSLTEVGMHHKREAYIERTCKPSPVLAEMWEREAAKVLTLPGPPNVGPGGEVVSTHSAPEGSAVANVDTAHRRRVLRNTLADGATRIAEDASVRRTDLLMQPSFDVVALGIDTADSIEAANSVEKMLAHQMAVAHEAAMRMADRGLSYEHSQPGDQVEACRCLVTAARLMAAFTNGALALQRLRTGGSQTVTVQHVTVSAGGQAVIGNVQPGGVDAGAGNRKNG
jgi:hypothetical protein